MPCAEQGPTTRQALLLGLLQGPAELLPVSSSAHITLLPWLVGSDYAQLDARSRKSFEVALHGGTAAALVLGLLRRDGAAPAAALGARLTAVAAAPAAVVGALLRGRIEQRLSGPRAAAFGLLAGSAAMLYADVSGPGEGRALEDAGFADALVIGIAQAGALAPGVSRSGATAAAARWRGFGRSEAAALSYAAGLPVLVGAGIAEALTLLRGRRLSRVLAAGALASFGSTLAAGRIAGGRNSGALPLAPFAVYRTVLALLVLCRLRHATGSQ